MAWGTLSHFYPYFGETRVDWSQELRPALDEASGARSPDEMYSALARLVAKLDDGHAQVVHAGRRMTGIVPLELRLVEGRLVVVGGLEPYLGAAPIGSEILSLEGVPAEQGYTRMAREVSAATDGYRSYVVPLFLTLGSVGGLRKFEVRGPDASVRELVVPLLPRKFKDQVREPRPKNGTQIDAGIFYIDVETIDSTTWRSLLSDLTKARGIVFDMRGYPSHTWTDVISNLTDKEISSPLFDIPLVRATGVIGYDRVWWTIRPNAPLLSRNVAFLVDGRAVSATETLLQMVRDHHLGILVGEPTAGTNGNLSSFTVPGGFEVNFTGMRALNLRGEVLHGRGIAPDLIVHPTLAGIRADRDEILEAALAQLRNREHGS